VSGKNHQVSNEIKWLLFVTKPSGFPKQLSIPLYLLPVVHGQSGSNVHETGHCGSMWSAAYEHRPTQAQDTGMPN